MFSNKQTSLLFNLRSQCVNEFRGNFFRSICEFCKKSSDIQEHALSCNDIRNHMKKDHVEVLDSVKYSDIFSDANSQYKIVQVFQNSMNTREQLRASPLNSAYLGINTGPGG